MIYVDPIKTSGTHKYSHLFTDNPRELENIARRLKLPIKPGGGKGKINHLDLSEHKRELAIKLGAMEQS